MSHPYIVITGCGSSGTKFAGLAWRTAGVHVRHELLGEHGVSSWYIAPGEGFTWINRKGVRLPPFKAGTWEGVHDRGFAKGGIVLLHQTRHPLKVISTVQRYSRSSWNYIYGVFQRKGIKIRPDMPLLRKCMIYWYYWNSLVPDAALRYQVENFSKSWSTICRAVGREDRIGKLAKIQALPKTVNSKKRKYTPRTWEELEEVDAPLTKQIRELGRSYGYKV